jgi:hypothetical protein
MELSRRERERDQEQNTCKNLAPKSKSGLVASPLCRGALKPRARGRRKNPDPKTILSNGAPRGLRPATDPISGSGPTRDLRIHGKCRAFTLATGLRL